jgi:RNA polymerase sigma-70 factor (ECF subfamily)
LSLAEDREEHEPATASTDWAPLSDPDFKDQLAAVIPHLRAFGRSLSGSRDLADDLVQETLLKAWAARKRFQAGTNMRAWTFIILRNLFLSQMRRARFKGEWDDITASKILAAPASQDRHIELGDMQRALMHLPQPQREALILVGAGGFAYEEAAEICGCAVGTIKSRVARGRVALEQLLSSGKLPSRRQHKTDPDKSRPRGVAASKESLVQLPQQILEITVARLPRRSLEGAAERGRNPGMSGRNVYPDDLTVHAV